MRELFDAHPELYSVVKELVENTHDHLYSADGGGDHNIISWSKCVARILEAAREISSLQDWAAQLDAFEEAERAKCERSAAA